MSGMPKMQAPRMPTFEEEFSDAMRGGGQGEPEPPTPEETQTLLGQAMGGVEWLGDKLSFLGDHTRGILTGQPGTRVAGHELLDMMGVPKAPENPQTPEEWMAWLGRGAAGFGVDVATDPLTYVTGPTGTLTKSGKAALNATKNLDYTSEGLGAALKLAKAGKLGEELARTPVGIADAIRAGDRALLGLSIPGIGSISTNLGLGSERAAKAVEAFAYGTFSPVRPLRGVFSQSAAKDGTALDAATQMLRDKAFTEKAKALAMVDNLRPILNDRDGVLKQMFSQIAEHHKAAGDSESYEHFMRSLVETYGKLPTESEVLDALRNHVGGNFQGANVVQDAAHWAGKATEYIDGLHTVLDDTAKRVRDLGGNVPTLQDLYGAYFPRRPGEAVQEMFSAARAARGGKPTGGYGASLLEMSRDDILRNVPGATPMINTLSRDPRLTALRGLDDATRAANATSLANDLRGMGVTLTGSESYKQLRDLYVKHKGSEVILSQWGNPQDLRKIILKNGDELEVDQAGALAKWLSEDPAQQAIRKAAGQKDLRSDAAQLAGKLASMPKEVLDKGLFSRSLLTDWTDYMHAILDTESTMRSVHRFLTQPGVLAAAGSGGVPLEKAWKAAGFKERGLANLPNMAGQTITEKAANALKAYGTFTRTNLQGDMAKTIDRINSVYKGMLYAPWPASHVRDFLSQAFAAMTHGVMNPVDVMRGMFDASKYARNRTSLKFADEAIHGGIMEGQKVVDLAGAAAAKASAQVPDYGLLGIFKPAGRFLTENPAKTLNPLNVRGVRDAAAEAGKTASQLMNPVMEMGERARNYGEFVTRVGYYEALRRKGFSPAQAMYNVKQTMLDYNAMSWMDRNVMRRAVPFWSFTRLNIPRIFKAIAERPGGPMAITIKAMADSAKLGEGYKPSFMQEDWAIPLPWGSDAAKPFFKTTALPQNDINKFVFTGGALNLQRTSEKFLSTTGPAITAPLEQLSGRQLATGRELKHLESTTDRMFGTEIPSLDRAIHYSPFSRMVGEYQGLTDDRKTTGESLFNLFAGLGKVSTYDTEKWKGIDLANSLRERLGEDPRVMSSEYFAIPEKRKEKMRPEEINAIQTDIRRQDSMRKFLAALRDKRKREGGM